MTIYGNISDFFHSTLTEVDEPYPMLVLCGPHGSGKGFYTQLLVEEFSSFFGLGSVGELVYQI